MLSYLIKSHAQPNDSQQRLLNSDHETSIESEEQDRESSDTFKRSRQPNRNILPLFSAEHLDRIPVYNLQHTIRLLIVAKCETTLTWDQLRTPQISQFLVKPLQQSIRSNHHNKATLYALLSNCLQFQKDGQLSPGTVGISRTRALVCELLAVRLLRDFTTRDLIDALFYDFDPLKGAPSIETITSVRSRYISRLSTIEIAIKAHSKHFIAHPLVVQQLEAVWSGAIVFHSYADTLHRQSNNQSNTQSKRHTKKHTKNQRKYGSMTGPSRSRTVTYDESQRPNRQEASFNDMKRKAVTLYDPSDASIFKLSRLRVPRYRQLFSTISYAIMIGLFLAVLMQRSHPITVLELIFWFWGAGYMLDELVGFSEQGLGLYIISVWNSFDIGILLMFIAYYLLRLYGIMIPTGEDVWIVNMAYDVLASTAVLLFPRLFSVLDHYRYFSQLLIAFRMMAVDLAAILVLIIISCSGFFVAFTMSFSGDNFGSSNTAYTLFQVLMGFTPAIWEIWDTYNALGKVLLVVFLIISHFLIVTMLITVLTNSFMAIVQNANEEHQFLFAVNTISMVKSDALFSYIPPSNIIGWLFTPTRLIMPFRNFIKFNRTMIKFTHLPILAIIFVYERLILSRRVFEPIDLVERRGRDHFNVRGTGDLFSPGPRLREPSVATFRKDQALDQVFRGPFSAANMSIPEIALNRSQNKSKNVVQNWMRDVGRNGGASTPMNDEPDILDRLETKRPLYGRHKTFAATTNYDTMARSVVSDPEETSMIVPDAVSSQPDAHFQPLGVINTDEEGDDELATGDEDEVNTHEHSLGGPTPYLGTPAMATPSNYITYRNTSFQGQPIARDHVSIVDSEIPKYEDELATPIARPRQGRLKYVESIEGKEKQEQQEAEDPPTQRRVAPLKKQESSHMRTSSSATMLFKPLNDESSSRNGKSSPIIKTTTTTTTTKIHAGPSSSSLEKHTKATKPSFTFLSSSPPISTNDISSPIVRPSGYKSAPNLHVLGHHKKKNIQSSGSMFDIASDLGDNRAGPDIGLLSGSFGTQWEMDALARRRKGKRRVKSWDGNDAEDFDDMNGDDGGDDDDDDDDAESRIGRMVLQRMTTLEEGFREVLREVKGLSSKKGSL